MTAPGRTSPQETTLLVDAANVVGSRPDGWWRDRAGAASRLLGQLAGLAGRTLTGPDGAQLRIGRVVVVLEGRARDVPLPAGAEVLDVVRAPGSGDDALAATAAELAGAGDALLVVTADHGLRARLPEGAAAAGPGWVWQNLGENRMTRGGAG
jgi:hypothetical protein